MKILFRITGKQNVLPKFRQKRFWIPINPLYLPPWHQQYPKIRWSLWNPTKSSCRMKPDLWHIPMKLKGPHNLRHANTTLTWHVIKYRLLHRDLYHYSLQSLYDWVAWFPPYSKQPGFRSLLIWRIDSSDWLLSWATTKKTQHYSLTLNSGSVRESRCHVLSQNHVHPFL